MRRFLIFFWGGLLLLNSCRTKTKESDELDTTLNKTSLYDSTTIFHYPRHEISYTGNAKYNQTKLKLDSLLLLVNCPDTIISYRINPITKQVLRVCASKSNTQSINYLLLDGNRIKWDSDFGNPNEFIGEYLFSDVYRGGELGGSIVKYKFKIADELLQFIDSIPGGSYSEGAGTWEWYISNEGQHKAIIFHGGDLWTSLNNQLLITPEESTQTYLIDLQKGDTILELPRINQLIWQQLIMKDGLLFATQTKPRLGCLQLYNLKGKLQWETPSDYLEKLIDDSEERLIIASGYFFSKEDNTQDYFTVAYDRNSGQIKWSFPTSKIYDSRQMLTSRVNTSNLFRIAENVYGMIVGQVSLYFGQNLNHSNKLILFSKDGLIYETLNLSSKDQNYSVVTKKENEFEIISNYETRRFKIYAP
jgi:hypothetical protein